VAGRFLTLTAEAGYNVVIAVGQVRLHSSGSYRNHSPIAHFKLSLTL
jgi:hypothetical protein